MKILHVASFFKPSWEAGGIVRVCYEQSVQLVARGHDVTVYTTDGFKHRLKVKKNKRLNVDGIKVYYFRNLSNILARTNLCIPYFLPYVAKKELQNFDIIHIHTLRGLNALPIWYYAKKYKIPYVLQAHGSVLPFFQKQGLKNLFDLLFGYRILNDASKVIALTNTEAEQYIKMGVDKNKIEIVPNGIDLSKYENLPDKGIFRMKYGIKSNEKIVLYLGRIHKIKGVNLLVESFSDLVSKIEGTTLVIVGPDDGFLSALKVQIEDLKIGDKIIFTGSLYGMDKIEAYVDADVYVLPSVYETFPMTVLEACACNKPMIVTDRCGISDMVEKVGLVVEYDKEQLCDAMFKMLSDDGLRQRFGEKGRRMVKNEFEWNEIVKMVERLYENAKK